MFILCLFSENTALLRPGTADIVEWRECHGKLNTCGFSVMTVTPQQVLAFHLFRVYKRHVR